MKSVLILTASFGEGHNAAARNTRDALLALAPDAKAVMSDPFLEAYGWFNRLMQKGYIAMINHAPRLWQVLFALLDRTTLLEMHMGLYVRALGTLRQLISEKKPEVIVSTYPGCNHLLDYLYPKGANRPFRTVTIVTDSITINSVWYRARSDFFLVANEDTAQVLRNAGVSPEKIVVSGFPVPRVFAELAQKPKSPPADGKWKILYMINSGHAIAPDIVRHLLQIGNISLTVTVGRHEALAREIETLSAGRDVTIHGWEPGLLPALIAEAHILISKAGGATVQEALAARTPMIVTQVIPGQEEGNARLILDHGAGAFADAPYEIRDAVIRALADDGTQWRQWMNAITPLSQPDASDRTASFVLALEQPAKAAS